MKQLLPSLCLFVLLVFVTPLALFTQAADAQTQKEIHVSPEGDDSNDGSQSNMLKTISAAALLAQPGDVITVHEGVYRESINPPRGGESDTKRITYQAAPGEKVEIKGSEVVTGWKKVQHDTWMVTLPNDFFGNYNPYNDLIHGDWFHPKGREHHTGAVYFNGEWLTEAARHEEVLAPIGATPLWYGKVDDNNTTLWAQFKEVDPNNQLLEINVRQTVFYPDQPNRNYITVRGFIMRHAATQWAPPTAEQTGLIGTHWSKGWIIENNVISHSICSGVSLGKHGDEFDNTSADTAEGYVKTIERGLAQGWNKETIGHHIVRNNTISYCEQTGIVGSLGSAFCTVTGNTIHDIHLRQLFTGAEMAGIKFHGAIDTVIRGNHIFRTCRGLWLDWMAQGTHVIGNLFHDNQDQDLFVEVDHGPFLVANNIFLSPTTLLSVSQGGAYVHNLIGGGININRYDGRLTPFHKAHSTELAGMHDNPSGDDRYYNNIIVQTSDLTKYDEAQLPVFMEENVYLKDSKPSIHEKNPFLIPGFDPGIKLTEGSDGIYLEGNFSLAWSNERTLQLVSTELLGNAHIPKLPYENADGSPIVINTDYFGKERQNNPFPGPFEISSDGQQRLKVWPVSKSK